MREMKVGPSEPLCMERIQTATSCCGQNPWWLSVMVKRRDIDRVKYELERRTQVNLRRSIENAGMAPKPGCSPYPGISMEETCLLPCGVRCSD